MIIRVNVVLYRTVVDDSDWGFDNLCGSHVFIGQNDQNDKNAIFSGRCAPSSPRYKHLSCKHILAKKPAGFHKQPTQHSFLFQFINYGKGQATTWSVRFWLTPSQLSTACDLWGSVYDIWKFYISVPDGNTVKAEREHRKSHTGEEKTVAIRKHSNEFPIVLGFLFWYGRMFSSI